MNYASLFIDHMNKHQNPLQHKDMEAYMKNHFEFLGVKSPERKAAMRSFIQIHGLPKTSQLESNIKELWESEKREIHYCAQEIFFRSKGFKSKESIELIEYMLTNKSWWDTVDFVASNLCGSYFQRFPDRISTRIMHWNKSENIWLIRASMLFQLKYRDGIDVQLLENLFASHLNSREFFIQKAIGWMLRETSKFNPGFVKEYVQKSHLKPVSLREATKYI
jgi:3-methyladenine DNA glycosylase AlkD